MIGYYFIDTRRRERLHVPFNLSMVRTEGGTDVSFNPDLISDAASFLTRNKTSLERGIIAVVDVPEHLLKQIRNCCFNGNVNYATQLSIELFEYVRRNWRGIGVGKWG